ncbi:hypothetical protein BHM03_00030610 [Ensete ventricosum]|nr:hypothetical protein BHM03_00030610 [Ensete ventricosum]
MNLAGGPLLNGWNSRKIRVHGIWTVITVFRSPNHLFEVDKWWRGTEMREREKHREREPSPCRLCGGDLDQRIAGSRVIIRVVLIESTFR